MAKTETPADSSNADSSRGALDARARNFSAKARLAPADLFDVGSGGFGSPSPEPPPTRSLRRAGAPGEGGQGVSDFPGQGARLPGPVRARDRRSVEELPFVDEEDVIEEESLGEEERFGAARESDFGLERADSGAGRDDPGAANHEPGGGRDDDRTARAELAARRGELEARFYEQSSGRRAAKLPLANLEPPSGPRLDLTPSPVPRVALAPATGSQDISLVPGPHDHIGWHAGGGQSWGSRNLPTLAAQHLIGGRQRRPAPAVTLPPPGELPREARASAERRLRSGIAKDVRSSKREIVLGLMIGLGLSMLLAAVGQAYLREEQPIADAEEARELESLTLSARPDEASSDLRGAAEGTASSSGLAAIQAGVSAGDGDGAGAALEQAPGAGALAAVAPPVASGAERRAALEKVARGAGSFASAAPDVPRRATPERARRVPGARAHAASARKAASGVAAQPPSFEASKSLEAEKSFEPPPSGRSPLSPAESAGLGLDLPL